MVPTSLRPLVLSASVILLAACGGEAPSTSMAKPSAAAPQAAELKAPAGTYKLDPNHASLTFKINHLGLSNYTARFTRFDAQLQLDPTDITKSSITVTVDPASVRTDYPGDYKAGHQKSPYENWDQDLAQSPKFFNAGQFPQATFRSTKVEQAGAGKLRVTGDFEFLGQTLPVTLEVSLVGSYDKHPFNQRGAVGFTAVGALNRSAYGMTHLLQPSVLVGDAVTLQFEGEFQQPAQSTQ
ncbi:MAG: YceI family protein [Alphaproteobacteria bacterium]